MSAVAPIISKREITKRFGGLVALDCVDLDAYAGEVLAIVGDNGAGKSTLIKILTGVYQPTEGHIELDGQPFSMANHSDAIESGIDAVYRNLVIADHLTPAQNLFLGAELTKSLPLKELPDDADRDFWVPEQVNKEGTLQALQDATGAEATKFEGTLDAPIQIALI